MTNEMEPTSDYQYFRYLMFLNYILGHFTTYNIFTKSSEKLEFKVTIVPLCSTLIQLSIALWVQAIFVMYFLKGNYLVFVHNISFVAIDVALVLWGLFFGSKIVIKSFKTAESLRRTVKQLSDEFQVPRTNPTFFATLTTLLFVALHLNAIHSPKDYALNFKRYFYWDAYILYTARYPHRLCLTLSSLYYLCGLAVLDTRRAWERYSRTYCRPYLYLKTFCTVLMEQTHLLQTIDKDLGKQVLLLLIYRSCNVVTNMPFHATSEDPMKPAFNTLMLWTILLGLLTGSICFTSVQVKKE
ncbi:hypothetical protein J6590_086987 [Homalodisca vitripennis]|nr:hypothetical protein J6590_086987 [Homalodisca vitripennis]